MPPALQRDTGRIEGTARVMTRAEGDESPIRLEIVAATDAPYRLWGFDEVLKMTKGAVDLKRLRNNAPFLADHRNSIDSILGRVEKPSVGNGELRVIVVLDTSERAREYARQVEAGMAGKISIGYRVTEWTETRKPTEDEVGEQTATRWQPLEVSAVAVPADDAASVTGTRSYAMPEETEVKTEPTKAAPVDAEAVRAAERKRVADLLEIGGNAAFREFGARDLAEEMVAQGGTPDELRKAISDKQSEAYKAKAKANKEAGHENGATGDGQLGLSAKDAKEFRLVRAIHVLHDPHVKGCEFEKEVMAEASKKVAADNSRTSRSSFTVPSEVFRADLTHFAPALARTRALGADAGDGANVIAENLLAGRFIELLRAMSVVTSRATVLGDLVGDVDIPRQTSPATAAWEADNPNTDDDESELGLDQVSLSPKELAAHTSFTRKLMIQSSPGIEMLVRQDFMQIMALAIDFAILLGKGTGNEPQGVFGDGTLSANRVDQDLSWDNVVMLETLVNTGNALTGSLAYVTSPKGFGKAKTTAKQDGYPTYLFERDNMNGYPVEVTSQIPNTFASASASTGGTSTALYLGSWSQVLLGLWSGVDIIVDLYSERRKRRIGVSAFQDVDVALRHAESFAYLSKIT